MGVSQNRRPAETDRLLLDFYETTHFVGPILIKLPKWTSCSVFLRGFPGKIWALPSKIWSLALGVRISPEIRPSRGAAGVSVGSFSFLVFGYVFPFFGDSHSKTRRSRSGKLPVRGRGRTPFCRWAKAVLLEWRKPRGARPWVAPPSPYQLLAG